LGAVKSSFQNQLLQALLEVLASSLSYRSCTSERVVVVPGNLGSITFRDRRIGPVLLV